MRIKRWKRQRRHKQKSMMTLKEENTSRFPLARASADSSWRTQRPVTEGFFHKRPCKRRISARDFARKPRESQKSATRKQNTNRKTRKTFRRDVPRPPEKNGVSCTWRWKSKMPRKDCFPQEPRKKKQESCGENIEEKTGKHQREHRRSNGTHRRMLPI